MENKLTPMQPATPKGKEVATAPKQSNYGEIVVYKSGNTELTLTAQQVKQLAKNPAVTNEEVAYFMQLCVTQGLNPFIKEIHLVKYGSDPAEALVSYHALLRKANEIPTYAGMQNGIVVQNAKGEVIRREGAISLKGETLLGGWARIFNAKLKVPTFVEVAFEERAGYTRDGQLTKFWKKMPAGQIEKCAIALGLRRAYPEHFMGMYIEEEMGAVNTQMHEAVDVDVIGTPKEEIIGNVEVNEVANEPTDNLDDLPPSEQETENDIIEIPYAEYKNNKEQYTQIEGGYNASTKTIKVKRK